MADNYLEKKMEEYRSKPQVKKSGLKPSSLSTKDGVISVKFPSRRVFVTGGAHGIGRAIVKAFRDAGCRVAFCDNDEKQGNATAQSTGAQFYPVDVTDVTQLDKCLDALFEKWGDIDIIVNNVGVGNFKPLLENTVEDFEAVLHTNLRPVYVTSRRLAMHRTAKAYGRIINIASTRWSMSESGTEGYAASKGAIVSLTHALMMSLAPLGITVNAVSPGWIECYDTNSIRDIDREFHPSGRVGRPEDIASIVMYLAAPESDFINGQNIVVDGGVTRKMIYPE